MLTWNVLCITSRIQNNLSVSMTSTEDRVIFCRLNNALVELVNNSRESPLPAWLDAGDPNYVAFSTSMSDAMHSLHALYKALNAMRLAAPNEVENFHQHLNGFAEQKLIPCIELFKSFCNENSVRLWSDVRAAQVQRMCDFQPLPDEPIKRLVSFYSHMMYVLGVLGARLQGFRYELITNCKMFGSFDPVQPLSEAVFAALELLMSDCVLATEPSTDAILVTNNLFAVNCGTLARGVVFKDYEIQIITEETAEQVQSEMRRQKMLQQPSPIGTVPSAALLAMKPTSGTKRSSSCSGQQELTSGNTSHKKADVSSKESVIIYPAYNAKNRYWAATYPHLLCTTRQKGRHSTNNSYQDLSPSQLEGKSSGKRPIFYFHIRATMFSPSGRYAAAHTLSLPFTIATRRNQDCQVQRMMSSYTATCFWLYGVKALDGLLINWVDTGMQWKTFKQLFKQHFKVNADVNRSLQDCDFDLLRYKLQCHDCRSGDPGSRISGVQQVVTFKNILCPHLRYECGSVNVRFSVWRGMLELLQIFQDTRNNVKKLWEKNLLMGFLEFDQVAEILRPHYCALVMRLSFVTGGTICLTVKSTAHSIGQGPTAPIHLEPLDLKKLQAKCLKDYLRDIAYAEKVKYVVNANLELVKITDVLGEFKGDASNHEEEESSRDISSNVTHSGDIDAMQHIKFTAMRIAVVTCKVKPPSSDLTVELDSVISDQKMMRSGRKYNERLPAALSPQDDFLRELTQLMNFHGKTKQDVIDSLELISDHYLTANSNRNGCRCCTSLSSNTAQMVHAPSVPHSCTHTVQSLNAPTLHSSHPYLSLDQSLSCHNPMIIGESAPKQNSIQQSSKLI
ncbi:hypothetical protein AB6A40_004313 [Gnathostoma spinigerum]|uniref:Uncharacterized protein n=1 Tax=Gnathostoma spinigerum TaxID=75299 RepID=A0ABD6EHH6_9BILA